MSEAVNVQILSPLNAGSNLMIQVLRRCFKVGELERAGHTYIWKHCSEASYFSQIHEDALVIVMVRHPLSWFLSIKKAPYRWRFVGRDKSFVKRQIVQNGFGKPGNPYNIPLSAKIMGDFPNLVMAWNHYYQTYLALKQQRPEKTIFVRYEDLIFHPEETVTRLSSYLALKPNIAETGVKPALDDIMSVPAKKHGKARTLSQALQVNSNVHLKFQFSNKEIRWIQREIDQSLVATFDYQMNFEKSLFTLQPEELKYLLNHWLTQVTAAPKRLTRRTFRRLRKSLGHRLALVVASVLGADRPP